MRSCIAPLACGIAFAATLVDDRIDDLARRIRSLSLKETVGVRANTLLEGAAILQSARPQLAAAFRDDALKFPRAPAAVVVVSRELDRSRRALTTALDHKAVAEEVKPLAEAFLNAIEHSGENPADYSLVAHIAMQYELSTGGDNPSVRARMLLTEMRDLADTGFDFALPTLNGKTAQLKAQRGHVVLLSFWATWCEPCIAEMKVFQRLMKGNPELRILAVSDESAAVLRSFAISNGTTFPLLIDSDRKVFDHYRVTGLPATKIIDATGRLRAEFNAIGEDELESLLRTAALP